MQHPGIEFLHERDSKLHFSPEVEMVADYVRANGEAIPNEPVDKLSAYIGFLAHSEYVNDGILTGDKESLKRQVDARIIKPEDVPENYFELQRRIAREQGYGDIEITENIRGQMIDAIRADQRVSLMEWAEYLGKNEAYPEWFKFYAWDGVSKLGNFDKEKGAFLKRTKNTVGIYPELNREALSYMYEVLDISKVQNETINVGGDSARLQKLLKSANFGKLYAHALRETAPDSPELKNDTTGSWVKYDQTVDEEVAKKLSGSLQGYGTGWCTAGENTASFQLTYGDFYVYYTRNSKGEDKIPRVAIRMENGKVAEVRGVNKNQELEPAFIDVMSEKLKGLPGGDEYHKKAHDMKWLTEIEHTVLSNPDTKLSKEEIKFLYEIDSEIKGFGYSRDPRINQIRRMRGERDRTELAEIMFEHIEKQFMTAHMGYEDIVRSISKNVDIQIADKDELLLLFSQKSEKWKNDGVYEFLVDAFIKKTRRFTLVIAPNIELTESQIMDAAIDFGREQSRPAEIDEDICNKGLLDSKKLSGVRGVEPVKIFLVPDFFTDDSIQDYKTATFESGKPSVLDAISYWHALRAQGLTFEYDENEYESEEYAESVDLTDILHYELEPVMVDGEQYLLHSKVLGGVILEKVLAEDYAYIPKNGVKKDDDLYTETRLIIV